MVQNMASAYATTPIKYEDDMMPTVLAGTIETPEKATDEAANPTTEETAQTTTINTSVQPVENTSEKTESETSQVADSDAPSQTQPEPPQTQPNDNKKENPMKKIRLEKVVLNMGMGKSGESINIAKKALEQITGGLKPNHRSARDSQRDWGVRKGEPIGVSVTVRGQNAKDLLKRLLDAKGNIVNGRSFDDFGNYSFGIREHIDIPGVKYEPQIGILGLGISVTLARPGYSIRNRSKHRTSIGRKHVITSKEAKSFIMSEFGVQVT